MKTSRYEYINDEQMNLIKIEHDKCTGCGACMKECPMLKAYCSSPKNLLYALASGKYFSDHDQDSDYIQNLRMPFTCTLCGYCDHVCPENVSLKNIFYALKKRYHPSYGLSKSLWKIAPVIPSKSLFFQGLFIKTSEIKKRTTQPTLKTDSLYQGVVLQHIVPTLSLLFIRLSMTSHQQFFLRSAVATPP